MPIDLRKSKSISTSYQRMKYVFDRKDKGIMESIGESAQFLRVNPILNVKDLKRSLAFYESVLGFGVAWVMGDSAEVKRGAVNIKLVEGDQGNGGAWFYILVTNIDKIWKEWNQKGAKISVPPTDRPWGLREMLVEDPDENFIRAGEIIDQT